MTALVHALITREGLERLDAALAWIDAHPEQHDQESWIHRSRDCGTTACLAGTLVQLAGGVPVWGAEEDTDDFAGAVRLPDGTQRVVPDYAAELLGLDGDGWQIEDLFYGAVTRGDLGRTRDVLAASLDGGS